MELVECDLGPGAGPQLEDGDFSFEGADGDGVSIGGVCPGNFPDGCLVAA